MSFGNYTRHVPEQEDTFNTRVRSMLDYDFDALEDNFENWPADRVKEAALGLQRADTKRIALDQNATAFVALHPEYIDNDANGETLNLTVKTMFGDCIHTVEQFEASYKVCLVNNSLEIDQAEVVKQQQKAANKQRSEAAKARKAESTVEDLYNMPLEEIRMRDAIEHRKQMQLAGERGGNGF